MESAAPPFLFDADAHVLEPPDLWDTYLEPRFRNRSIQFRRTPEGIDSPPRSTRSPTRKAKSGLRTSKRS